MRVDGKSVYPAQTVLENNNNNNNNNNTGVALVRASECSENATKGPRCYKPRRRARALSTDLEVELPEFVSHSPDFVLCVAEVVEGWAAVALVPNQQSHLLPRCSGELL